MNLIFEGVGGGGGVGAGHIWWGIVLENARDIVHDNQTVFGVGGGGIGVRGFLRVV